MPDPSEDQTRDYCTAVGHALTDWSTLEHSLCRLFCISVGNINNAPAYQAFWAVVAFDAKLKMTGAAVIAAAKDSRSLPIEWAKTYRSIRAKSSKRNEIAHGTLVTFHSKGTSTYRLMPYYWAGTLNQPLGEIPEGAMTIKQIEDARRAFRIGDARINKLSIALQSWLMKRS